MDLLTEMLNEKGGNLRAMTELQLVQVVARAGLNGGVAKPDRKPHLLLNLPCATGARTRQSSLGNRVNLSFVDSVSAFLTRSRTRSRCTRRTRRIAEALRMRSRESARPRLAGVDALSPIRQKEVRNCQTVCALEHATGKSREPADKDVCATGHSFGGDRRRDSSSEVRSEDDWLDGEISPKNFAHRTPGTVAADVR